MKKNITSRFALCLALAFVATSVATGCGGDDGDGDGKEIKLSTDTGGGNIDGSIGDKDGGATDTGSGSSSGGVDSGSGSSGGTDAGAEDTSIKKDCPGGAGCACTKHDECEYGLCAATPEGRKCAAPCNDECKGDFECKSIAVKGGDNQSMCVHKYPLLCTPCKSNAACSSAFDADAKCIDRGKDGTYCGATCKDNADCPSGYACDKAKDIEGNDVSQCVTDDGSICKCSTYAIELGASTKCNDADGCAGERKCLKDGEAGAPTGGGLSQCAGAGKKEETCDGLDNNCDGKTDEGTCDDKNSCTADSCDTKTGKCTNAPQAGSCDDGDACTESDKCDAGKCTGAAKKCDDSNPCTTDSCKAGKCESANDDTATCDDNDKCTEKDACKDGKCAGAKKNCDDGNKCSEDTCKDGKCSSGAVQAGPCQDGDACTLGDKCENVGGKLVCKAGKDKPKCDDTNDCTVDSCDAKKGCVNKVDDTFVKACYTGDAKFKGVGACKAGKQKCKADGTLGKCEGEVLPANKDVCGNGADDDCDGTPDNGCAPSGVIGRFGTVVVSGAAGKNQLRAFVGGSMAAGLLSGTKHNVELGFYAWVSTLIK